MNASETRVLLSLLRQNESLARANERLAEVIARLTEELSHARSSDCPGAGAVVSAAPTTTTIAGYDITVPLDLGARGVLRPALGLDADRRESGSTDLSRVHPDLPPGLRDPGLHGLDCTAGDSTCSVDPGGLHGAGGPGAGEGEGDRGGDPVQPGADGAGDDQGRVGDGDANDGHANLADESCSHRATCECYSLLGVGGCAGCIDRADGGPAGPPAPVALRHCSHCGQDKPAAQFRNRIWICDDCREAAAPAARACSECGTEKPISEFSRKPGRGGVGGYSLVCRSCAKGHLRAAAAKARAKRWEAPPAPAPAVAPHKACTRCNQDKPLTEFAAPYEGTLDKHDFLCSSCRALATAERERRGQERARKEQVVDARYAGRGKCPHCAQEDTALYSVNGNGGTLCYPCLLRKSTSRKRAAAAVEVA